MTITIVIIKPQKGNAAGLWMTSCPEEMVLRIWGFWKRVSWRLTLDHGVKKLSFCHWGIELSFLPLRRKSFSGHDWRRWIEILNITRCTVFGVESDSMVSIVRIVSLSSCRRTEVKKLISRSYLKQQSPPVFVFACPLVFLHMYM